jgi:hypothetical protein
MTWVLGLTAAAGHIDAGIARAHLSLVLLTSIDGRPLDRDSSKRHETGGRVANHPLPRPRCFGLLATIGD